MMPVLKSETEVEAFLERHQWCEDCHVTKIDPFPPTIGTKAISLELRYLLAGTFTPGSVTTYRAIRFTFHDVLDVKVAERALHDPEHCAQGVDIYEPERGGIRLWFELPDELEIEARTIEVTELSEVEEVVVPFLSEVRVSAVLRGSPPEPDWWSRAFEEQGHLLFWHMIEGELRKSIGTATYDGWFLQTQEDYDRERQGLFFRLSRDKDGAAWVSLDNQGLAPDVWEAAKRIVGQLDSDRIYCGNCWFDQSQWFEALGAGGEVH